MRCWALILRELERHTGSCQAALRVRLWCRVNMETLSGNRRRWRVFQIRIVALLISIHRMVSLA